MSNKCVHCNNNFFTIDGKEIEVKAWKEIVLPKLKEIK